MTSNGIVHRHVPPYHPSSNGLAENLVKTVKQALSKCKVTKMPPLRLTLLVFYPRTEILATVHTTSRAPAELLFNRAPRTCLSLIHPCTPKCLIEEMY